MATRMSSERLDGGYLHRLAIRVGTDAVSNPRPLACKAIQTPEH
jgi:hypothetical protein